MLICTTNYNLCLQCLISLPNYCFGYGPGPLCSISIIHNDIVFKWSKDQKWIIFLSYPCPTVFPLTTVFNQTYPVWLHAMPLFPPLLDLASS